MSYITDYNGYIGLDKPMTKEDADKFEAFVHAHEGASASPEGFCQIRVESFDRDQIEIRDHGYAEDSIKWLRFLIEKFFKPMGYILNGSMTWLGSDASGDDEGTIDVTNSVVTTSLDKRDTLTPDEVLGLSTEDELADYVRYVHVVISKRKIPKNIKDYQKSSKNALYKGLYK